MTLWVGTSWKMTKRRAEAQDYASGLASIARTRPWPGVQPFVLPPITALGVVHDLLRDVQEAGQHVLVGVQNAHWEDGGAWTGEISVPQASDAGAEIVEIGHSERRAHFGESDETVRLKTAAAVRHGVVPLVCIGETHQERAAGRAVEVTSQQLEAALRGHQLGAEQRLQHQHNQSAVALVVPLLIAYEPVWAIGWSGREPQPEELADVVGPLARRGGAQVESILYGGSVTPASARSLLDVPGVGGLFVGRSAWDLEGFVSILETAASIAARRGQTRIHTTTR